MKNKNNVKKRKGKKRKQNNRDSENYDLRKNLGRVNQRESVRNTSTSTKSEVDAQSNVEISSDMLLKDMSQTGSHYPTGDSVYGEITELRKEVYSANKELNDNTSALKLDLEQKINSLSSDLGEKRDSLRKELEGKISDKVDKAYFNMLFIGAISVITAVGGVMYYKMETGYNLSQSNSKDIKTHEKSIEKLKEKSHDRGK